LLDVPIFELVARRSAEALASVFTRCRADAACREAFPDPAGDLATVLRDLRRQPSTIEVRTPVSTREVTITADAFADAIHELLVRSRGAEIPATLALAAAGDLGTVGAVVAELEQDDDSYRLLMSWAIRCSEPWARFRPGRVAALGPDSYLLGSQLAGARTTRIACAAMPPLRDDEENGPVRSDLPVLLLNGAEDPQDPPSNVTDAPVELPNSLAIEVVGYGHTVGHLGCLPDVVAAFFASGTVQDLETACVTEMEPPPFALP
jgi:pimeloyl-ACP methyl ester carboxylesterase